MSRLTDEEIRKQQDQLDELNKRTPRPPPAPQAPRPPASVGQPPSLREGGGWKGVDQRFLKAAQEYSQAYDAQGGRYGVRLTSGYREGSSGQHGRGNAIDMQLYDKKTGADLPNYHDNVTKEGTRAYQEYANGFHAYLEKNYPDLAAQHRWGGYFAHGDTSTDPKGYGTLDLMHHDLGGRSGLQMQGGSWQGGFTPEMASRWGINPGGGTAGGDYSAVSSSPTGGQAFAGASPALVDWVAKKEAFNPNAFGDYGQTNIGYGTSARGRTSITEPEARQEMTDELNRHLQAIDQLNPNIPYAIRNSLASLAYNTGGSWITEPGNQLAQAVKNGDWNAAQAQFMRYTHAGGQELPGLVNRRTQEAAAFTNPNMYGQAPAAGAQAPSQPPASGSTMSYAPQPASFQSAAGDALAGIAAGMKGGPAKGFAAGSAAPGSLYGVSGQQQGSFNPVAMIKNMFSGGSAPASNAQFAQNYLASLPPADRAGLKIYVDPATGQQYLTGTDAKGETVWKPMGYTDKPQGVPTAPTAPAAPSSTPTVPPVPKVADALPKVWPDANAQPIGPQTAPAVPYSQPSQTAWGATGAPQKTGPIDTRINPNYAWPPSDLQTNPGFKPRLTPDSLQDYGRRLQQQREQERTQQPQSDAGTTQQPLAQLDTTSQAPSSWQNQDASPWSMGQLASMDNYYDWG